MKAIIALTIFLAMTTQSFAYSLQELEGKYRVSSKILKMENSFTLDRTGFVHLRDQGGNVDCKGPSKIASNKITTVLTCKNTPAPIIFKIDLNEVNNLNRFTANVDISIFAKTAWDFERLEN